MYGSDIFADVLRSAQASLNSSLEPDARAKLSDSLGPSPYVSVVPIVASLGYYLSSSLSSF
jgi:hypothetical protein